MTGHRRDLIRILRPDGEAPGERAVAIEAPVAIEIDGLGYAVMMMTPLAFDDFACGFLLTERLIDSPADIVAIEPFESTLGWIVRVALAPRCKGRVGDRVRHRTSDGSCGLCGISGLEQLHRPLPGPPPRVDVHPPALFAALAAIRAHQPLNRLTGAVHAAAACDRDGKVVRVCEDVGRHNALDKLIGHMAQAARPIAGFLLVTSRISFEMVDKALVALVGDAGDNAACRLDGLRVVGYDIPEGCIGAYYPECNLLIPVSHHARESHVLAGKSVPVRIEVRR